MGFEVFQWILWTLVDKVVVAKSSKVKRTIIRLEMVGLSGSPQALDFAFIMKSSVDTHDHGPCPLCSEKSGHKVILDIIFTFKMRNDFTEKSVIL